jgi:hypothetical protein
MCCFLVISNLAFSSIFQINLKVQEESEKYGDILLENFYESYNNLTIKSLMLLKLAVVPSLKSEYIFKVS